MEFTHRELDCDTIYFGAKVAETLALNAPPQYLVWVSSMLVSASVFNEMFSGYVIQKTFF